MGNPSSSNDNDDSNATIINSSTVECMCIACKHGLTSSAPFSAPSYVLAGNIVSYHLYVYLFMCSFGTVDTNGDTIWG